MEEGAGRRCSKEEDAGKWCSKKESAGRWCSKKWHREIMQLRAYRSLRNTVIVKTEAGK